jgi:UDP-glucose 6-dehydrogenase
MKIGIVGLNDFSIGYGLSLINSGFDVIFYDLDKDIVFNLKNKIYTTSENYIQAMLLDINNINTTDDAIDLIKHSETIFYFTKHIVINEQYDVTPLNIFFDELLRASNSDVLLYDKNFVICAHLNLLDINSINSRLVNYSVNVGYLPNLVTTNNVINYIKNINYLIIGTSSERLINNITHIHNRISKKFISYYYMSPQSAELTEYAIETLSSIKNSFIDLFGDVIDILMLTQERNVIIKAIGNNPRLDSNSYKYNNFNYDYINTNIINQFSNTINTYANFEINSFLTKIYSEHINLYISNLKLKNPSKEVPFIFKNWKNSNFEYDVIISLLSENYNVIIYNNQNINERFNDIIRCFGNLIKFYKKDSQINGYTVE